jgi:Ca2+-binding RTX toxin-like protein
MSARRFIHRFESFEPRLLLASFASLNAAGVLSVVGDSHSNTINVTYSGSNVKVTRDGSSLYFDKTKVKKVWAEGYGGNDKVTIGVALPSTLIGDAGNDTLTGNVKGDEIHGGSGDDRLIGGNGNNLLDHGSGNDVLDYSAMQPGKFDLSDLGLTHPDGGVDIVGNSRATVLLTPGNDTFIWGGQTQELDSHLIVDGGAGNDAFRVNGFPYRGYIDRLNGGAGNDTFWFDVEAGGVGYIDCGPGNDVITDNASEGKPANCDGGPGHDSYSFTYDWMFEGGGELTVPPGIEEFSAAADQVLIIHGNDLDNSITGIAADVTLYGNGGNDRLFADTDTKGEDAQWGHGLLDGGSGNDTLIGNAATVFKGGSGNDTADFSNRTANLNISLDNIANDGESGDHANVLADVETVIGGSGNDKIIGNPFANNLQGGSGNDTLYGGAGNDTLTGGPGHDLLFGQDGNDVLYAKDGHTDTLDGGSGFDSAQRDNSASIKDVVMNVEFFI